MHEINIVRSIVEIIEASAVQMKLGLVHLARLKMGRMTAFQADQVKVYLSCFEKKDILKGMKFEIEEVPVTLSCNICGECYQDDRFDDETFAHEVAHAPAFYLPPQCPACGAKEVKIASGDELELVSIEGE